MSQRGSHVVRGAGTRTRSRAAGQLQGCGGAGRPRAGAQSREPGCLLFAAGALGPVWAQLGLRRGRASPWGSEPPVVCCAHGGGASGGDTHLALAQRLPRGPGCPGRGGGSPLCLPGSYHARHLLPRGPDASSLPGPVLCRLEKPQPPKATCSLPGWGGSSFRGWSCRGGAQAPGFLDPRRGVALLPGRAGRCLLTHVAVPRRSGPRCRPAGRPP